MKIRAIIDYFEQIAPLSFQESYDNAGLIIGNKEDEVKAILIALDVTEEVVQDAIEKGANLIVAHHPVVFSGLKRFNGNNYIERTVIKAIKNDIAIFAAHTNLDSVIYNGVNTKICEKIGLENVKILSPVKNKLLKLVVFVPTENVEKVREAIFNEGAGNIGTYDSCSFGIPGTGTFKAGEGSNPFVGEVGTLHEESEIRLETVVPSHLINKVVLAMKKVHPYEEVAYDIYTLENKWDEVGMGMIGNLPEPMDEIEFLLHLKEIFSAGAIKYTQLRNKKIKKVAVCGGAGSFLLNDAVRAGADIFITGDFKYHQFFDADGRLIIADVGHFESEQYTKELFYELLTRKFSNFAIHFTKVNTNPIKYI
jgi:dinuclear metal center YbgI/SA1388 family protein